MKEVEKNFLPIGTVVMLKEGKKRVMITGFCISEEDKKDKVWDYSGCFYPEGMISSKKIFLFDQSQIEEIFYKGFVDDEEIEFKKKLKENLNKNTKN